MRLLRPLPLKDAYWRYIRAEIERLFDEALFKVLFQAIGEKPSELSNSVNSLAKAIQDGRIWVEDGEFKGSFNAAITRALLSIGAVYSARTKAWIFRGDLPPEVSAAITVAVVRYQTMRRAVLSGLDELQIRSIDAISEIPDKYVQTIHWMEGDFQKAVSGVTIPPVLTDAQVGTLAAEWGMNLDLYVRSWVASDIIKMRQIVMNEAFTGRRAESIAGVIREQFGVSRRKAHFLARQETSLLMSAFHRERFKDAGVTKFKWSTSQDERVRDSHEQLDGKIFSWGSAPMNARGVQIWPGTDFGCRCVAIPVLDDEHEV